MLSFFLCVGGFETLWVSVVSTYVLFCKHFRDVSCSTLPAGEVFGIDTGYVEFVSLESGHDWLPVDVVQNVLFLSNLILVHGEKVPHPRAF